MTVDRIEPLDKRRCKVFLDGDFAFVLYQGELKQYQIEVDCEMEQAVYDEIFSEIICKRTRERALYLLQFSGRTQAELERKLLSAFYPERAVAEAVAFLREYHYLDDKSFVRNYIEVHGTRKSRAVLVGNLLRKGVDRECIEEILSEQEPDEEQLVRQLLKKRGYTESMSADDKRKTIASLMRKGFSYDTVRSVICGLFME